MSRDDLSLRDAFEMLQSLSASEPGWMVSCQPTLRDAITPLGVVSDPPTKPKGILTFSMIWQWSEMKRKVPESGILICMPISPGRSQSGQVLEQSTCFYHLCDLVDDVK